MNTACIKHTAKPCCSMFVPEKEQRIFIAVGICNKLVLVCSFIPTNSKEHKVSTRALCCVLERKDEANRKHVCLADMFYRLSQVSKAE